MIRKLRQVLAVTVLLLFSWENVVLAVSDVNPEKFSAYDQVSSLRGPGNIFSWILEENENEEHGDHKAHGTGAEMLQTSLTLFTNRSNSKSSLHQHKSLVVARRNLDLIRSLRI